MENGNKNIIWFVDDEHTLARMLKYDFNKRGYDCEMFLNVDQAVEELEKRKPDLIITDFDTGKGKNGLDLLKMAGDVPIIMQSGTDFISVGGKEVSLKEEAEKHGVRKFLRKPFNIVELVKTVDKILPDLGSSPSSPSRTK